MGSLIKTRRKPNWTDNEINLLIHVWNDNLQKLSTNKRKQQLFDDMSKQMESYGVARDAMEIRIKILNLKKKFREEKVQVLNTGTPSQWQFYSHINEILGDHVNIDGRLKDTSTRCEETPVNAVTAESGPVTILRFAQKEENEGPELYYIEEHNEEEDSNDICLEGDDPQFHYEPSSNPCNESESNKERKEAKRKFIEELYEEYKETKQSLADTDKKLLELLNNQNSLIKTQNELCRTQNSLLTSLLEKMN